MRWVSNKTTGPTGQYVSEYCSKIFTAMSSDEGSRNHNIQNGYSLLNATWVRDVSKKSCPLTIIDEGTTKYENNNIYRCNYRYHYFGCKKLRVQD